MNTTLSLNLTVPRLLIHWENNSPDLDSLKFEPVPTRHLLANIPLWCVM